MSLTFLKSLEKIENSEGACGSVNRIESLKRRETRWSVWWCELYPTLCDPRTVAHQAPLSVGFSRQDYCSELPFPSPRDLPDPGIEPWSPALQADSLPSELQGSPVTYHRPNN